MIQEKGDGDIKKITSDSTKKRKKMLGGSHNREHIHFLLISVTSF